METEQAQIVQMSIGSIITIATSIVGAMGVAIGFLFLRLEKKNDVIIELTRSYVETNIGVKTAVENNTRVIEKLPETIAMQIKANK